MPLTAAEKQKRYREHLKATGQYDEFKARQVVTSKKSRDKQKQCDESLTTSERNKKGVKQREATRQRVAKWRKLKKEAAAAKATPSPFRSAQAYAKATSRAKRMMEQALPKSPKRRKAVCKKLYEMECSNSTLRQQGEEGIRSKQKGLDEDTIKIIQAFYERDDISRQAPGRKDVVTIRDAKGAKTKHQKRHLTSSILEVYALFREEYPDIEVGKSKFADLRPKHVLLSSKLPHNVCLCRYHENFINVTNAIHKVFPECPAYSHDLPEKFLCEEPSRACWLNECPKCMDGQGLHQVYSLEESADMTWMVWKTNDEGRMMKVEENGTSEELLEHVRKILPQFLEHCFIKRNQAASYNAQKVRAMSVDHDDNVALLQVDFSENYTCVHQDEVQSAHWQQRQVSLFTAAMWHNGMMQSHVVVSDNLTHSKDTVVAYMDTLLDKLPDGVKLVYVWSDGPASQFKNRFIAAAIATLQKKHNIQVEWNFFCTSHGKGPVDGIGGSVKRHVWKKVSTRKSIVTNAASFVQACADMSGVTVHKLTHDEIQERNQMLDLKSVFDSASQIIGITRMHFIKHMNNEVVCSLLSTDDQASTDEMPTNDNTAIQVGDWYAVDYDGILYPGEVVGIGAQDDYKVSVMEPAGQNWKWPTPRDEIYYPTKNMMLKIQKPEIANNRCHYKFTNKF